MIKIILKTLFIILMIIGMDGCTARYKPAIKVGGYHYKYTEYHSANKKRYHTLVGVVKNTKSNKKLLVNQLKKDIIAFYENSDNNFRCTRRKQTVDELKRNFNLCINYAGRPNGSLIQQCRRIINIDKDRIITTCRGESISKPKFYNIDGHLLYSIFYYTANNSGRMQVKLSVEEEGDKLLIFIFYDKSFNSYITKLFDRIFDSPKKVGLSYMNVKFVEKSIHFM